MKKIIASLAALAIACTMCISAFAITVTSNDTIPEDEYYYTDTLTVISDDSTVTFTNNGDMFVDTEFALIRSNLVNNGYFDFLGDTFQIGAIDDADDCSVFTNNDEMEIVTGTFTMSEGTVLENNGVMYIAGIENYSLNGTIRNNGYILYNGYVNPDLIAELKENCPDVLSFEEYLKLIGPVTELPGDKEVKVRANYIAGQQADTVYSVDVEWGAMQFTYADEIEGTWDPATHTYKNTASAGWKSAEGNYVTVANHSNAPVTAEFTYKNKEGYENLTGTLSIEAAGLGSGVGKTYEEADSVTSVLTITGELPKGMAESNLTVGTVTVTISEKK